MLPIPTTRPSSNVFASSSHASSEPTRFGSLYEEGASLTPADILNDPAYTGYA